MSEGGGTRNWKSGASFRDARRGPLAEPPEEERTERSAPWGSEVTEERDTNELSTNRILESTKTEGAGENPHGGERLQDSRHEGADEDHAFDESGGGTAVFDALGRYRKWALLGAATLFFLLVVALVVKPFGGVGEGAANDVTSTSSSSGVRDTGITIDKPEEQDGTYYLKVGDIAWKGKTEETDNGEVITLEGATAAQFKRVVTLPHGSVMTGVFGRAEEDQPVVYATFNRTTLGADEYTDGTYDAIDGDKLLVEGTYRDERSGDTVTRTYTEKAPDAKDPATYAVSFKAPQDTPIPALIGWKPPASSSDTEKTDNVE